MRLFRYSEKIHNQSLLKMGLTRVGTLYDFRNLEHKKGIADPKEGKKTVFHLVDEVSAHNANDIFTLSQFGINVPLGANIKIDGITLAKEFDTPDLFVLCFSKKLSIATMQRFEGANSCLEIVDQGSFFNLLTMTLCTHTPVIFRGVFEVRYQEKSEIWNGCDFGHHPALTKDLHFSPQYEVRAIWEPQFGQRIQPLIIGDHRLGAFCRETSVVSDLPSKSER